jgi:hypothetical protein
MSKVSGGTDRHNPIKPAPKLRPKSARFVRLVVPPDGLASGVVRVMVGAAVTHYAPREFKSDVSGRAFELTKRGLEADGEVYHVSLAGSARTDTGAGRAEAALRLCSRS